MNSYDELLNFPAGVDLNGDGLQDLVAGTNLGSIMGS